MSELTAALVLSERDFWRERYEIQHRTLHSCEDALAEARVERNRAFDLLGRIRQGLADGTLDVPEVCHAVEAEIADLITTDRGGQP